MPIEFGFRPGRKQPWPDFVKPRLWVDDFSPGKVPHDFGGTADWCSEVPQFPMDLNDQLGDCGIASMDHYQMSASQYGQGTCTSWGGDLCEQLYEELGGYVRGDPSTDNGTVLQDNLAFWRHNPINGSRIRAFGALKQGTWLRPERIQALQAFGPLYLGLNLPQSAEHQFPGPWEYEPYSPVAGGHCVTLAAEMRGRDELRMTTWGAVVKASTRFMLATVEEAWVIIDDEGIERNGANQYGWDLTAMNEALAALTGQSNVLGLKTIR